MHHIKAQVLLVYSLPQYPHQVETKTGLTLFLMLNRRKYNLTWGKKEITPKVHYINAGGFFPLRLKNYGSLLRSENLGQIISHKITKYLKVLKHIFPSGSRFF